MKRWFTFLSALHSLCAVALLPSCGDEAAEDKLKTVDGFCSSWAAHACSDDMELQCGADSEADCVEAQTESCLDTVGRSSYSGVNAEACLNAVRDAYLDGRLSAEERDTVFYLSGDCDLIQSGDAEEGDVCEADSDCQRVDGFACIKLPGESNGTCETPVVVSAGRSCKGSNSVCEEGFFCGDGKCVSAEDGDPCSAEIPCGSDYRCAIEPGELQGLCVDRLEDNDPTCRSDGDCKSNICQLDGPKAICAKIIQFQATDDACSDFR